MFSGSSRLKLDYMKFYTMLQDVNINEVSNFFNISFKNKLQYIVNDFLFVYFSVINWRKWTCWSKH